MKNLCGYPRHSVEKIEEEKQRFVLVDIENYGMGPERSLDDFMEFSGIKINYEIGRLDCPKKLKWCVDAALI